jgi:hypothetical protein
MQNIFKFLFWTKKSTIINQQETPFKNYERVDLQCFTDICIFISAKRTANIQQIFGSDKK